MDTTKPWDKTMKWLVRTSSQALISFLLADAMFKDVIDRELQVPSITADTLFRVIWQDEQIVLHIEFQRNHDPAMGRRLWEYNALTNIHTKLPVYSVVIYLVKDKPLVESPYVITLPGGQPTQRLDFGTIKLWEIPSDFFEQQGLVRLLPLLPLTKDGKKPETLQRMIDVLKAIDERDLLAVGYACASLVFTAEGDHEWLKERFFTVQDILRDSWVFQELINEGLEEGKKVEKKQDIIRFVEIRFPAVLTLAKQKVEQATSLEQLQALLDKLYQANTIEEVTIVLQTHEIKQ